MDTGVSLSFPTECCCLPSCTVSHQRGRLTEVLPSFAAGQENCSRWDGEPYSLLSFPETPHGRYLNGGSPSTSS